eukprot:GHVN01004746.1.p1 GENE.GHVN01004746.1~~GHVN01004746.1.p1  ORF type:complete len:105 (+),score=6.26 GHVN01004746.1:80-394(+)
MGLEGNNSIYHWSMKPVRLEHDGHCTEKVVLANTLERCLVGRKSQRRLNHHFNPALDTIVRSDLVHENDNGSHMSTVHVSWPMSNGCRRQAGLRDVPPKKGVRG